jgi:uncharacterized Zn finger protein
MSYFQYKPYVPVAKRRAKAAKAVSKMMKGGQKAQPVAIEGRKIATTFWGHAWCENLEHYSDYANRLPRGKTYARNGSVIHLEIEAGKIHGMVQGSELYQVAITISPLEKSLWTRLKEASTGKITNLLDLIQGKLPKDLLQTITAPQTGLFPKPKEIQLGCSCPDGAYMCKHVAAVLYGVGNRLDKFPELFFTLRSLDMGELISSASAQSAGITADQSDILDDDLADIFGIEMETTPTAPVKSTSRKAAAKKVAKKAAKKATKKAAKKAAKKGSARKPAAG